MTLPRPDAPPPARSRPHPPAPRRRGRALLLLAALIACGKDGGGLAPGQTIAIELSGLRALDPATEGRYEAWAYGSDGAARSLGRFDLPDDGRLELSLPDVEPRRIAITVEPPGDTDAEPSPQELLGGEVRDGGAELGIVGSVTPGFPLEPEPGAHSLFTSSNNVELGYPSYENSGIWLFTLTPEKNRHRSREVKLMRLTAGWLYEGWVVRRIGTPEAVWISYGKYRPDEQQLLSSRDNTGSGPFSGDLDYRNGGIEDVPGDEWTTNVLGLPVPGGLELPLRLDEVDEATGEAVWTHVITIEPAFDEDEPLLAERPFLLRPYRNPISAGGPGVPRIIRLQDDLPKGRVRGAR